MSTFKYFTGIVHANVHFKLKCENESEVLLSECSVGVKQSGDEDDSS